MHASKSILVVDDDPAIHQLLKTMLASPAWDVDSALDGEEGLALVHTKQYDLVLTDVRMPGMDGLELLRRIREERPGMKVLVMTADNTSENVLGSLRRQAFGYFGKPFVARHVLELVEQALAAPPVEDDIQVLSAQPDWVALDIRCRL